MRGWRKLFLPPYLSARHSGLYNNSFDYNHLQEKNFAEIYRILLKFSDIYRKYHYFHFCAAFGSMRAASRPADGETARGAVCGRGGNRRLRTRPVIRFHGNPSHPFLSPPSGARDRTRSMMESSLPRAARTIPQSAISGMTAIAGKCGLNPPGEGGFEVGMTGKGERVHVWGC